MDHFLREQKITCYSFIIIIIIIIIINTTTTNNNNDNNNNYYYYYYIYAYNIRHGSKNDKPALFTPNRHNV